MRFKLSVVVPVYNVSNFLVESVYSLQKFLNNDSVEILLVDDGSTDQSGKIADDLKKKYSNVKVYHKKNGGLSSARNFGLSHVTGQYTYFFDSDDQLQNGFSEVLLDIIEKSTEDIILFGYSKVLKNRSKSYFFDKRKINTIIDLSKDEILTELLGKTQHAITGYAPTKIYKTELIQQLKFKEMYYEDMPFFVEALMASKRDKFVYINTPGYNYLQREASITHVYTEKKLLDKLIALDIVCDILVKKKNIKKYSFEMSVVGYLWVAKLNQQVHSKIVKKKVQSFLRTNRIEYMQSFKGLKFKIKFCLYGFFL